MIEPPSRPKSALDSLIASYSKEKDFKKYREQLAADLFELYNRTVFDNQVGEMRGRLISILKMNCYNLKILTEAFLPWNASENVFFSYSFHQISRSLGTRRCVAQLGSVITAGARLGQLKHARFWDADGNRKRTFHMPGHWCLPDFCANHL